ncbi:MAG: hypothetical protein FJY56_01565 [Betaproteobacteria bacterium]|nr:hypothetical protein [Betaproteobacteria bacterium]
MRRIAAAADGAEGAGLGEQQIALDRVCQTEIGMRGDHLVDLNERLVHALVFDLRERFCEQRFGAGLGKRAAAVSTAVASRRDEAGRAGAADTLGVINRQKIVQQRGVRAQHPGGKARHHHGERNGENAGAAV